MKLVALLTLCMMAAGAAMANPAIDHKMGKKVEIDPAMKLEYNEKGRLSVPGWCAKWFDGCNHCVLADKGAVTTAACTGLVCSDEEKADPYCTEKKK
ncbi:MAG: hypothetical protein MRY32_03775 [Rickettsiales bacterium]|nr:hypothetical protein [Rickettsiales bacterium]